MAPPHSKPANEDLADVARLIERMRAGERRAISRAVTELERLSVAAPGLLQAMQPHLGHALVVGFTGPPGAGKSTLVNAYTKYARGQGKPVGIIAVDPSSPVSGGAILGDRIRMTATLDDDGVFMRSLASRGHLGGLSPAAVRVIDALDAAGKDIVLIETVGTGQSEVEIIGIADTVLLVLMPGSGDSVQALKAGIMEIPDVIAINKMDHPAAKTMLNEVRSILALDRDREWRPPIVLTEATRGENVPELWEKIVEHRGYLESSGQLDERRRKNLAGEVFAVASARAKQHIEQAVQDDPELRRVLDAVQARELDPLSAVREILEKVFKVDSRNT